MAQQPSTPAASIFGAPATHAAVSPQPQPGPGQALSSAAPTPPSAASSSNTYIMPNSPAKARPVSDGYRPKITRTLGQRPACLVNASVTYCGNNRIYAFGGFDQYTDEVYNHVLRLDLACHQWSLVDNYGDIPGVRMGHTATLYKGDKLLVFGGENEHRTYLSDLIVFDLKTAHWTQPQVSGPIPKGRARHAAVLHEDKLFIIGGITGQNNYVLDDICYLDLRTFTWSKAWRFVGRFDHSAYIWDGRVWVFGGLSADMDKISDLWWLDLKGSPETRTSGYAANSRTAQVNPPSFQLKTYAPLAPGSISAVKFISGPTIPSQGSGIHYHAYSSGTLLDFVTPAPTITPRECSLSALDLATLRWQKLAEGREIFKSGYRWHYCTMNEDGTKAWLLGCPTDPAATDLGPNGYEEYLSDIMEIDLRRYGFLGNNMAPEPRTESRQSATARALDSPSKGLGADLARLFNHPPESGSGTDFVITALAEEYDQDDAQSSNLPIHVHKLILQARWPHFARLYNSQMAEFHTKKMHIPEPYSVVKAFLLYLYTDSIRGTVEPESDATTDLSDVAGLLVMSNIYNIPHLRLLCVNRLAKELDVEHACVIWYCAGLASEEWLRKRAATFCMTHWGRIVRTQGFLRLPRSALVELSQEIDMEGRVVAGEELEWGNMPGRYGDMSHGTRKESISSSQTQLLESEADDDDGMELN
ncbi:galactose oxidase, central domain-containing protein [Hirsutella rhossiliensis]|uniref:Galactose oxidase, central domain-containing protein n=1 Tax=Hirsutella rhossiliensis TaxID=111463 RepID=A0A9P8MW17_9HYPO|nr:galactose oxidase, central domain-containing protein [Hirsutella rhossiliensis]KAH0962432.1 galactose oxidase, central domain-containing protein [Hirsutella rhossiliensis]